MQELSAQNAEMNIVVASASPPDHVPEAWREYALPEAFPFLIDAAANPASIVIEPVLQFLCDRYLRGQRFVFNTALAAAHDLQDWWRYLDECGLNWDTVDEDDLRRYGEIMLGTLSPVTHMRYAGATVRRRVGSVLAFYSWAHAGGRVRVDITKGGPGIAGDRVVSRYARPASVNRGPVQLPHTEVDLVRPFTPGEYQAVARALGPLPSEQGSHEMRPARDRLAAELALHTGMRVDEVASLLIWQIEDLRPDACRPYATCWLPLSKTKGLRPRKVAVPNWLVLEVLRYIDNERAAAIATGVKRGVMKASRKIASLFVNGQDARHHAGLPMRRATAQASFRSAVVGAGLVRTVAKADPHTREPYTVQQAAYSFHSLRHTYAIWMYGAEKSAGNAEPWKKIQTLLGHARLSTTIDTYLRVTSLFEAEVSDVAMRYFSSLRQAQP